MICVRTHIHYLHNDVLCHYLHNVVCKPIHSMPSCQCLVSIGKLQQRNLGNALFNRLTWFKKAFLNSNILWEVIEPCVFLRHKSIRNWHLFPLVGTLLKLSFPSPQKYLPYFFRKKVWNNAKNWRVFFKEVHPF
jgi:hypothetical protein